eukprot:8168666-Pyramimonas_sp.AAC.1
MFFECAFVIVLYSLTAIFLSLAILFPTVLHRDRARLSFEVECPIYDVQRPRNSDDTYVVVNSRTEHQHAE